MHSGSSDGSSASTLSIVDLAVAVSALQAELLGVKAQRREDEAQNASLRQANRRSIGPLGTATSNFNRDRDYAFADPTAGISD